MPGVQRALHAALAATSAPSGVKRYEPMRHKLTLDHIWVFDWFIPQPRYFQLMPASSLTCMLEGMQFIRLSRPVISADKQWND